MDILKWYTYIVKKIINSFFWSMVVILPDPNYRWMKIWKVLDRRVMQVVQSSNRAVVLWCCHCGRAFVENSSDCEVWKCRIYREQ